SRSGPAAGTGGPGGSVPGRERAAIGVHVKPGVDVEARGSWDVVDARHDRAAGEAAGRRVPQWGVGEHTVLISVQDIGTDVRAIQTRAFRVGAVGNEHLSSFRDPKPKPKFVSIKIFP